MKRKLTCSTPYGDLYRTTARTYSHAVVAQLSNGSIHAMAWCGNQRLAEAQLRYWLGHLKFRFPEHLLNPMEISIYPVKETSNA